MSVFRQTCFVLSRVHYAYCILSFTVIFKHYLGMIRLCFIVGNIIIYNNHNENKVEMNLGLTVNSFYSTVPLIVHREIQSQHTNQNTSYTADSIQHNYY